MNHFLEDFSSERIPCWCLFLPASLSGRATGFMRPTQSGLSRANGKRHSGRAPDFFYNHWDSLKRCARETSPQDPDVTRRHPLSAGCPCGRQTLKTPTLSIQLTETQTNPNLSDSTALADTPPEWTRRLRWGGGLFWLGGTDLAKPAVSGITRPLPMAHHSVRQVPWWRHK